MKMILLLITFLSISVQSAEAAITHSEFLQVKKALYQAFEELRPSSDHKLIINTTALGLEENYWWNLDVVHASYSGLVSPDQLTTHNIFLMGGLARLEGMTPDGLALTGCHEIAHGIGGSPKKELSPGDDVAVSSEGQSDYYATYTCLPVVLKYLEQTDKVLNDSFVESLCEKQSAHTQQICMRLFTALESDIYFFATFDDLTSFESHSTEVALELNESSDFYPSVQCRVDTMIHGILKFERPECWYPGGAQNGFMRN